MRLTRAVPPLAAAAVLVAAAPAEARCRKTFTVPMVERAINATYHGTADVSERQAANLRRYTGCARSSKPFLYRYWHEKIVAWNQRRNPPLNGPVVASTFDDAGATACGTHYTYGFASLILPCGATITMVGPSGQPVRATMEDHGPYVGGRTFDLNYSLRNALGCGDICSVRWR